MPVAAMAATLAMASVGYGLMEAAFGTMIARKHDAGPMPHCWASAA